MTSLITVEVLNKLCMIVHDSFMAVGAASGLVSCKTSLGEKNEKGRESATMSYRALK